MQCKQVADRIEITPDTRYFSGATTDFIRSLANPKWHGFDKPSRRVWTVLDTLETRKKLIARGWSIVPSPRSLVDMLTDLERLIEMLDFDLTFSTSVVYL